MAYLTLYRKYRPESFQEVIGQDHLVRILSNGIELDRLTHAYIFSGPRGTGKTSLARILAKSLNCRNGKSIKPCLKCDLCESISKGSSVDTVEIDAASNRGIDEIRQLKEGIYFTPIESQYKIYIIDEAHMLTDPAFNALLKTLEEPPPKTIFILATTAIHKIPLTILSRCQRLDFKLIKQSEIETKLVDILKKEKVEFEEKVTKIIAREARGSLRDAISLLDQLMSYRDEKIKLKDVFLILGTSEEGHILELLESILLSDIKSMLALIEKLTDDGKNLIQVCHALVGYFRYLLMLKLGFLDLIDIEEEAIEKLKKIKSMITLEKLKKTIGFLGKVESEIKWQSEVKIYLEINLLELITILENKAGTKEDVVAQKEPQKDIIIKTENKITDKQDHTQIDLMSIKHAWNEVLLKLKEKKISVYTLMCEGELNKFENNVLYIIFKKGYTFHKEKMTEELNKRLLEDVLFKNFGIKIKVEFFVEGERSLHGHAGIMISHDEHKIEDKDIETEKLVELFEGKVLDT